MQMFTIGHSNHSIEQFLNLLNQHGVTAIADVRSSPYSRRFPHFNQAFLRSALSSEDISYVFLGDQLGARPQNLDCHVDGQARYELIAATEAFDAGLDRIAKGAMHYQIALMCAEQDPITCHRAILVCRHLRANGFEIQHILKTGNLESHEHLEKRLLRLHNLDKVSSSVEAALSGSETQLQLFNSDIFSNHFNSDSVLTNPSLEDLISQSYQLQGERIAYVEEDRNL